jgi:hypothetical protein
LDGVGDDSVGRSTVAGDRAAAGTPSARQTPVISGSGEVESARGSMVEASGGFIGAGAGRALARSEHVEHVEVFFCPCSTARRDRKHANLGQNPAQASS